MTTHSAAAEQKTILVESEQPERKSVVDDFAGYRALRRRAEEIESAGLEIPFFQPRDGVSHIVIRRNDYPIPAHWRALFDRRAPVQTSFFEAMYAVALDLRS